MINLITSIWTDWLNQNRRWIPTITLIPLIYFLGWLSVQPLRIILPKFFLEDLSLIGTLSSFILFLLFLPSWTKYRWGSDRPWFSLGLTGLTKFQTVKYLSKGVILSLGLILLILIAVVFSSSAILLFKLNIGILINAFLLGCGIGIAEELVFRGWLLGELNELFGPRIAIFAQAGIFSLAHITFSIGFFPLLGLLFGLFLLGLLLAQMRILSNGSLWSCIGLHGGLVGIWFVLVAGLIEFSPNASIWIVGPGGSSPNPIGGIISIITLLAILLYQRNAFAIAGTPLRGARSASSKGALP